MGTVPAHSASLTKFDTDTHFPAVEYPNTKELGLSFQYLTPFQYQQNLGILCRKLKLLFKEQDGDGRHLRPFTYQLCLPLDYLNASYLPNLERQTI